MKILIDFEKPPQPLWNFRSEVDLGRILFRSKAVDLIDVRLNLIIINDNTHGYIDLSLYACHIFADGISSEIDMLEGIYERIKIVGHPDW